MKPTTSLLFVLVGLTACATMPMSGIHTLPIGVPDPRAPVDTLPTAPAQTRVPGGTTLDLQVSGGSASRNGVIVTFAEPIVRRGNGPWLYTVRLNPGNNRFELRPHTDGLCHEAAPCRFVIIQVGNPHRRSVINTPVIIIDPQQMH